MKRLLLVFFLFSFGIASAQVGIGTTSPDGQLDVENEASTTSERILLDLRNNNTSTSGSGSNHTYSIRAVNATTPSLGVFKYGIHNNVSGLGTATRYGIYNEVFKPSSGATTTDMYGVYATLGLSTGVNSNSYGFYADITNTGNTANIYGVYSTVAGTVANQDVYSGYFLGGKFSIGQTTSDNYILPASRGAVNQIMVTDGAGNVNWADAGSVSDDHDFYEEGTTTSPDDINDDMYTQGNVAIGKNTADYRLDVSENASVRAVSVSNSTTTGTNITGVYTIMSGDSGSNSQRALYSVLGGAGDNLKIGAYNNITSNGDGDHTGTRNDISGSGGDANSTGIYNNITRNIDAFRSAIGTRNNVTSNTASGNKTGTANTINGPGAAKVGTSNSVSGAATSSQTGVENNISSSSNVIQYGVFNNVTADTGNNSNTFGSHNTIGGAGTGNKYGVFSSIANGVGGTHYGVYSTVPNSGGYSGYFLGRFSIGTTSSNNYIMPASRGTNGQVMETDGAGNVSWVTPQPVSSVPIYSNAAYNMNHGIVGMDLGTMNSSLEPTVYNPNGNIEVKLVIRYSNALGTNHFQLRAHDGTTQTFPITNAGWTYAATQNGGVATSPWVAWNAGMNAHEIHVFGWNQTNNPASDSVTIDNAYLLVRSQ